MFEWMTDYRIKECVDCGNKSDTLVCQKCEEKMKRLIERVRKTEERFLSRERED